MVNYLKSLDFSRSSTKPTASGPKRWNWLQDYGSNPGRTPANVAAGKDHQMTVMSAAVDERCIYSRE